MSPSDYQSEIIAQEQQYLFHLVRQYKLDNDNLEWLIATAVDHVLADELDTAETYGQVATVFKADKITMLDIKKQRGVVQCERQRLMKMQSESIKLSPF